MDSNLLAALLYTMAGIVGVFVFLFFLFFIFLSQAAISDFRV
jgi:hypothetical protein